MHLAIWRDILPIATVVTSSLPLLTLAVSGSFVLRARFALGYWPQPARPDPAELGFGVHWFLAQLSVGVSPAFWCWLLLVVLLPFVQSRGRALRLAVLTALPWFLWLPLGCFDLWHFVTWCFD